MKSGICSETYSEVDRLKEAYSGYEARGYAQSKWSGANRGNQAIEQERWRALEHLLQSAGFIPLDNRRILDIGCGSGKILAGFESWGAKRQNLFGVDLLADRIKRAKEQFPEITFRETNAE